MEPALQSCAPGYASIKEQTHEEWLLVVNQVGSHIGQEANISRKNSG
jgi:hypothetical protein